DVTGVLNKPFQKNRPVAERFERLVARTSKGHFQIRIIPYYAHPPATTARRRLQHQWIANPARFSKCFRRSIQILIAALDNGYARPLGNLLGLYLVAQHIHYRRRWANEHDALIGAPPGECCILR